MTDTMDFVKNTAIDAALAGGIAGISSSFLFDVPEGTVFSSSLLGNASIPVIMGITVAGAVTLAGVLSEYAIPEDSAAEWDEKLSGWLPPVLTAVSSVGAAYIIAPGSFSMGGLANLAIIAVGSAMAGNYIHDNMLGYADQPE